MVVTVGSFASAPALLTLTRVIAKEVPRSAAKTSLTALVSPPIRRFVASEAKAIQRPSAATPMETPVFRLIDGFRLSALASAAPVPTSTIVVVAKFRSRR